MYRYTKVAAQKLTKTVIETAIAGGGGLVDTLRHSYSMNDLRGGQHTGPGQYNMYEGEDDRRVMPRSWHEGRGDMMTGLRNRIVRLRQGQLGGEGSLIQLGL